MHGAVGSHADCPFEIARQVKGTLNVATPLLLLRLRWLRLHRRATLFSTLRLRLLRLHHGTRFLSTALFRDRSRRHTWRHRALLDNGLRWRRLARTLNRWLLRRGHVTTLDLHRLRGWRRLLHLNRLRRRTVLHRC